MTGRFYVDSNLLIYYVEGAPDLKSATLHLFANCLRDGSPLLTSEITAGECLIGAMRSDHDLTGAYRELLYASPILSLQPLTLAIVDRAAVIGAERNLKLIDAIHVATAEALQCTVFLTNDRGISAPAGMEVRHI